MRNILLVEDDPDHAFLIEHTLVQNRDDLQIHLAPSLATARRLLDEFLPDLALVDLNLGDGQGTELLPGSLEQATFPIVILTSHGNQQDAVAAIKAGAIGYEGKEDLIVSRKTAFLDLAFREWGHIISRRKIEASLRESEQRYRHLAEEYKILLEGIEDTLLLVSEDLQVIWSNKAPEQIANRGHCFVSPSKSCDYCPSCPAMRCAKSRKKTEGRVELPDGRVYAMKCFPLTRSEVQKAKDFIVIATDITEQLKLHKEQVRTTQLAGLGELAAGVAHEINNPINGIINYAQLLLDEAHLVGNSTALAQDIIIEGQRVSTIVKNLLMYSRHEPLDKRAMAPWSIVADVLNLTAAHIKNENIELYVDVPHDLPMVLANRQQIMQVLINLLSNARYALAQKFEADQNGRKIWISSYSRGPSLVAIEVLDNGTGIPAAMLDRVTEAFYSSKPAEAGTGLGLSISLEIAREHDGDLVISSEEGVDTRVTLKLPIAERDADG